RNNSTGYADPETDEILLELRSATSADEQKDAIAKLQERVNETVPYVLWGPATVLTVWDTTVHDVVRSSDNIILLDKTWVDCPRARHPPPPRPSARPTPGPAPQDRSPPSPGPATITRKRGSS